MADGDSQDGMVNTNVRSNVDVSDHSERASADEFASHNTTDNSTGHNVNISSDSHNQTAGGNLSDYHG
ncbi:MAG TPA: hypothetical protein VKB75_06275, partial [Jatrophihabitans sp.]|nr:hypothetical protein [Jatrophihabitans sp.]